MSTMKTFHEELWTFPCDLNVKAMGLADEPLEEIITAVATEQCSKIYPESIASKESSSGKYRSITLTVHLESKSQAENLYIELGRREEIKWTL